MVLSKLPVQGLLLNWMIVGAGGDRLDIFFSHQSFLFSFSHSGRHPNMD